MQVAWVGGGPSEIRAPQIGLLGTRGGLPQTDPRGARSFRAAGSRPRSTPPRGAPSRCPQVPPVVRTRPRPEHKYRSSRPLENRIVWARFQVKKLSQGRFESIPYPERRGKLREPRGDCPNSKFRPRSVRPRSLRLRVRRGAAGPSKSVENTENFTAEIELSLCASRDCAPP